MPKSSHAHNTQFKALCLETTTNHGLIWSWYTNYGGQQNRI